LYTDTSIPAYVDHDELAHGVPLFIRPAETLYHLLEVKDPHLLQTYLDSVKSFKIVDVLQVANDVSNFHLFCFTMVKLFMACFLSVAIHI
jgi:hypothetical protein